jgi:hypothetical protein
VGNPEVILAGTIELFERYPEEIVQKAVSVVFGIPGRFKFMPRLSEIRDFLEELMGPIYREDARQENRFLPEPIPDRSKRKTYVELVELCAKDGLHIGPKGTEFGAKEIAEFREKFGISYAQWNATPDAK